MKDKKDKDEKDTNKRSKKNKKNRKKSSREFLFLNIILVFVIVFTLIYSAFFQETSKFEKTNQFEIQKKIEQEFKKKNPREVNVVEYSQGLVRVAIVDKVKEKESKENKVVTKEEESNKTLAEINKNDKNDKNAEYYEVKVNPKENVFDDLTKKYNINYEFIFQKNIAGNLLKLLFYGFLIYILYISVSPMLKSKSFREKGEKVQETSNVSFDDIGGLSDEVKKEIMQTQELIKNPELAKKLDLKPSKGILLEGPSGTGKTLIAKAIANSFNAKFFTVSGSDFVELFAGMGAKKVRDLFEEAQKESPSVIFIDEIDAVAKKRSTRIEGSNDEREQTLNQLLVCMDGTEELSDILIIAATNRADMLDSALLRPGRFDYKIKIDLPDVKGRKEIIDIHSKNKPLTEESRSRLDELAQSTTGLSGAQIQSIFEIAAYQAFNAKREEISFDDINVAFDRIILGSATRSLSTKEAKERVAYHEAGHAVTSTFLFPNSIRKVTIIPRGGALGFVSEIPKEGLQTNEDLFNDVVVFLAGGVAEETKYHNHSNGVDNDVENAKKIVGNMAERWGMTEEYFTPTFSEKEKAEKSKEIYQKALNKTKELIEEHQELFEEVTQLLIEKETIDGKEIAEMKDRYLNRKLTINNEADDESGKKQK